jgi:ferredoxin-NADP reductase
MAIYELTLKKKEMICDDVMLFCFESKENIKIEFRAGQYVNIFIDKHNKEGGHQGRSYTMMPTEYGVSIAVRKMGEFSSLLHELDLGNKVTVDGPHGTLFPRDKCSSFVCIAGGIGIAPFVSWFKEFKARGDAVDCRFLISNSFKRRAPFIDTFSDIKNQTTLFFTKENKSNDSSENKDLYRRIGLADIENIVKEMSDADFAVCGSISFTRDIWKMLKKVGVLEEKIFTEAFF